MLTVTKLFEFEAAHFLPGHERCKELHGHSYRLEVEVSAAGAIIEETGMVLDFSLLKTYVQEGVISVFDHSLINSFIPFPSAENMIKWIVHELKKSLPDLMRVRLWETSTSYAEWKK